MTREEEATAAALVILAEAGISPDTQELLVNGNPLRRVPPGALQRVIAAAIDDERERAAKVVEEHARLWSDEATVNALGRIAAAIRRGGA